MTVLAFPLAARRPAPLSIDDYLKIQWMRDQMPSHRVWWFNSLSDEDQARISREAAAMPVVLRGAR